MEIRKVETDKRDTWIYCCWPTSREDMIDRYLERGTSY